MDTSDQRDHEPEEEGYESDQFDPELEYDNQEAALLPPEGQIWDHVNKIHVPTIDLGQTPIDPVKVLIFLNEIGKYHYEDRVAQGLILQKALQGKMEREWMIEARYDLKQLIQRILRWVRSSDEWAKLEYEVKTGRTFSSDREEHIRRFMLVAKYLGYKAEDVTTKERFIRSLKPFNIPLLPMKDNGKYKKFSVIVDLARATPSVMTTTSSGSSDRPVAAATIADSAPTSDQQEAGPATDPETDTLAAATWRKGQVRPRDSEGARRETASAPASKIAKHSGKHACPTCGYMHYPARHPPENPYDGIPCFMCGEVGHFFKDCPERKALTESARTRRE